MENTVALETIREIVPSLDLVGLMEEGFVAYSAGRCVVPPVGELIFEDPPGDQQEALHQRGAPPGQQGHQAETDRG